LDQLVPGWATSEVMLGSKQLKKALKAGDALVKKGLERLADGLGAALANVLVTTGCDKVTLLYWIIYFLCLFEMRFTGYLCVMVLLQFA
jgi:hypothetical protein